MRRMSFLKFGIAVLLLASLSQGTPGLASVEATCAWPQVAAPGGGNRCAQLKDADGCPGERWSGNLKGCVCAPAGSCDHFI